MPRKKDCVCGSMTGIPDRLRMGGLRSWLSQVLTCAGFALGMLSAGCGSEAPAGDDGLTLGDGQFGDACERTEDCESGLCVRVGEMGGRCSQVCTTKAECPSAPNWACLTDEAVEVSFCACRGVGTHEVCGDGLDNDCDGLADDCRMCAGEAVDDADPRHCRGCGNACRADQTCEESGCACPGSTPDDCAGACTDRASDPQNCGECGMACGAGQSCVDGACACPEGLPDICDQGCVDYESDPLNCGACGVACEPGLWCVDGMCSCPDDAASAWCGAAGCRDLESDPLYCGACDVACAGGQVCDSGECVCPDEGTWCAGDCVDLSSDAVHCGECDVECTLGTVCTEGECLCPNAAAPNFCESAGCVDLAGDDVNCGACGNACSAGKSCVDGECVCDFGREDCGSGCIDVRVDFENCGACGASCEAGQLCRAGHCSCTSAGLELCEGACVDLRTDDANCGACGNACENGETCDEGFCFCDGRTCDGVCRPWEDVSHCGGCGNACAPGQSCDGYQCRCPDTGLVGCGETCDDLWSSEQNCGACGVGCRDSEVCRYGQCACPSGQTFCEQLGRCVNLSTDTQSCGACGTSCRPSELCTTGACHCSQWYQAFCASANACVDTMTNPAHCGGCDVVCQPGQFCVSGYCACPGGQEYCESAGTCVTLNGNDQHCGGCDNVCPAETSCVGSACACDDTTTLFCDGECKTASTDEENCGACGNVCAAGEECIDGQCGCPLPAMGSALRLTDNGVDDRRPALAWDGTHVGLAYVRQDSANSPGRLRFALLNPDGTLVSDVDLGGVFGAPTYDADLRPSLAWTGTEYGVTWIDSGTHFMRLEPDGTPKGPPILVSSSTTASLAWSDAYGGYALGLSFDSGFRRLGVDGSAPEAFVPFEMSGMFLGDIAPTNALLPMPDGGFTLAYPERQSVGFARLNAAGSLTLPITSVPAGSVSVPTTRQTHSPSLALHDGVVYTAYHAEFGQVVNLNRGVTMNRTPLVTAPEGTGDQYFDPELLVVRDSLLFTYIHVPSADTNARHYYLTRYALPAPAAVRPLHAPVRIDPTGKPSTSNTSIVATTENSLLAVWADERGGTQRELYVAPIQIGACP